MADVSILSYGEQGGGDLKWEDGSDWWLWLQLAGEGRRGGLGEAARSSSAVSGLLWSGSNNAAAHMVFTHSVASTLDTSTNTHPCERLANSPDKHTCDRYCRHLRSDGSQKYVRKCLLQAVTAGAVPVSPSMGQTDMCSGRWGCRRAGGFFLG